MPTPSGPPPPITWRCCAPQALTKAEAGADGVNTAAQHTIAARRPAVCWAQPAAWLLWKVLPQTRWADVIKLVVFLGILAFVGNLARLGRLPRTRPIVPGELAVSD